jgi:hypothetical protein
MKEKTMSIRGSCHCGKIAYSLNAELPTEAIECNCSICRRKGHLLAFFTPDKFTLETSRDEIAVYAFGKHVIRHQFCKTCGCAPVSEGVGPNGEAMVAINLRCAEGIDISKLRIMPFDGASL